MVTMKALLIVLLIPAPLLILTYLNAAITPTPVVMLLMISLDLYAIHQ